MDLRKDLSHRTLSAYQLYAQYCLACAVLNDSATRLIKAAIERSEAHKSGNDHHHSLVDAPVCEYNDVNQIRKVIMDLFTAAQSMTGGTCAWLSAELEARRDF
ncbi:hypothetical protein BAUCODRAFT_36827 [Baudoinia panamericana UAMH 10762]|uniref:Uncharacterized protein n=1 Tax=Baudoinia panamericana (strain UAMH 10762) TaxID=717646 RepID=M2LGG7_BAUPA|nr:uncharacterized protein BAUCODRAFT_36827 [Baudoinia panamericana UAMH 10762]EMC93162.1 hypothetical protein BAUCODRAFT_36827 [Baudoinia panamericana UAMH 10762]